MSTRHSLTDPTAELGVQSPAPVAGAPSTLQRRLDSHPHLPVSDSAAGCPCPLGEARPELIRRAPRSFPAGSAGGEGFFRAPGSARKGTLTTHRFGNGEMVRSRAFAGAGEADFVAIDSLPYDLDHRLSVPGRLNGSLDLPATRAAAEEEDDMSDFLTAYSIQNWLESCPQGYLENTEFGHAPGEGEPALLLENEVLRADAIRTTVQLVVGERCALAASSGLINAAPDEGSKRFLATQTLDEARHVEIFTKRLHDLGVRKERAGGRHRDPCEREPGQIRRDPVGEGGQERFRRRGGRREHRARGYGIQRLRDAARGQPES